MRARELRSSSVSPSEKYSCFGSPLIFTNGSTAIECSGGAKPTEAAPGGKVGGAAGGARSDQDAIAAYTKAIHLDPGYALAFAGRSLALGEIAGEFTNEPADVRPTFQKAEADAQRAIELAPELAEGHLALAGALFFGSLDFTR